MTALLQDEHLLPAFDLSFDGWKPPVAPAVGMVCSGPRAARRMTDIH
jgi:hypothetical protein